MLPSSFAQKIFIFCQISPFYLNVCSQHASLQCKLLGSVSHNSHTCKGEIQMSCDPNDMAYIRLDIFHLCFLGIDYFCVAYCQALSISQSLNLSLSLRDRADTIITLYHHHHHHHHRKLFKHLEVTYSQV